MDRGRLSWLGNAIESYLEGLASRIGGVNLVGAAGLNAKLERFSTANALPKKLISVGKYQGIYATLLTMVSETQT